MNNFGMLYRYEIKKILNKKFTIISLLIIYAMLIIFSCMYVIGHEYVGDKYVPYAEALKKEINYDKALTGLPIDDHMVKQTYEAFMKYRECLKTVRNGENENQGPYAQDLYWDVYWNTFKPYYSIYRFCLKAFDMVTMEFVYYGIDDTNLYSEIEKGLQDSYDTYGLTNNERDFWNDKSDKIQTPLTFYYHKGYEELISAVYFMCAVLMIYTAISLSGVFADEKASHCDQLILSSKNGKNTVYFAKLAAGLTITEGAAATVLLVYSCLIFAILGTDGFSVPIQLYRPLYPYPVSIGTFLIIAYLILLIIIMLISLFVMFISVNTDRSIIPLGIIIACVILGMFIQMPMKPRAVSQIWALSPINYLYAGNIYDLRLIPFFGHYLVSWQAVPWFYIAAGLLFFVLGRILYVRCRDT